MIKKINFALLVLAVGGGLTLAGAQTSTAPSPTQPASTQPGQRVGPGANDPGVIPR